MSESRRGNKPSKETIRKRALANTGKKRTEETKRKMSIAKKGKRLSLEHIQAMIRGRLGKYSGVNHPNWIADRSKLKRFNDDSKDRRSSAYKAWRNTVWQRDGLVCKINNIFCVGRIEAHHILGYTEYPELRYETNNGITLCHAHHPRKRAEEKRLSPYFQELVSVSNELF